MTKNIIVTSDEELEDSPARVKSVDSNLNNNGEKLSGIIGNNEKGGSGNNNNNNLQEPTARLRNNSSIRKKYTLKKYEKI